MLSWRLLEVVADGQVVNKGRILLYLRGMGVKGRKAAINMVDWLTFGLVMEDSPRIVHSWMMTDEGWWREELGVGSESFCVIIGRSTEPFGRQYNYWFFGRSKKTGMVGGWVMDVLLLCIWQRLVEGNNRVWRWLETLGIKGIRFEHVRDVDFEENGEKIGRQREGKERKESCD